MKKSILLSILFLSGIGLYAQNITTQTIRWHINQTQEVNAGKISEDPDQIVSYGTTKIEWKNSQGIIKKTFTISETNGSWTNVQSIGSILYEVNAGEQLGTVRISRTSSELTIRITLIKGDDVDPDFYEMSVTDLEIL
jgi:hypothetical protein